MPHRAQQYSFGGYHHLYNRAIGEQVLFAADLDYLRCLRLLKRNAQRYHVAVIAYCLMPTHYHLVVRQDGDDSLSRFVQTLFNAYVQAINKLRERRGPLFEGRFRSRAIEDDAHLLQACRYVHLNPVTAGLASSPGEWPYSNYLEWVGEREGTLVDRAAVDELCLIVGDYRAFVEASHPPPKGPRRA